MKVFSCYSIKGGVGKTALAVNLAYYLRERGQRTLLVDLDPQGASAFYFRVSPALKFSPDDDDKLGTDWVYQNIRESDFTGLDILPPNLEYRNFDVQLAEMKKPRKQLKKTLHRLDDDYDAIVLDCPPNITLLSENIFRASTAILVPVIPTTLSARTLHQLDDFFRAEKLDSSCLWPFFSMVQHSKRLHRDVMAELRQTFPQFLKAEIPFSVEVENMGLNRKPLLAEASRLPAATAYRALCNEILDEPSRHA
jgi:chromosome partitioning protein